jgi:protein-S-isoprenylcysteine O-methyltransferase Ste14
MAGGLEESIMNLTHLGQLCFKHRGLLLPVAIVILLIPSPALARDPAGVGVLGLLVALVGQAIRVGTIGLAYIIRGGKDHRVYAEDLVTTGIYAHVRNPMYFGNAFLLAGMALATNSWLFVLVGVPIAVAVHVGIIAAEEDFLRGKFGSTYDLYCARVPRILPRLAGLPATLRSMKFDWRRVLTQEYAKAFDWIVAIIAVVFLNLWRFDVLDRHPIVITFLLLVLAARVAAWLAAHHYRNPSATVRS